jgi:hypothetical protein
MFSSKWNTSGALLSLLCKSRPGHSKRRRQTLAEPRLEALEDRSLPSILTVTSTADSGAGSLRAALAAAQSGDTINFALPNHSTIQLSTGTLNVAKPITILGPGASALTVEGPPGGIISRNDRFSIFTIPIAIPLAATSISGLTVSGGGGNTGGGIDNSGILNLSNCVITDNHVLTEGGGIENTGALYMTGCVVSQNSALTQGGGINSPFNTVTTITGSSITGNSVADGGGGALFNNGFLTLMNSAISNNSATGMSNMSNTPGGDGLGGAIDSEINASFSIVNCTFSHNSATGGGATNAVAGAALGGALRLATSGTISSCTFTGNSCLGGTSTANEGGNAVGGAIEWVGIASPTITDCTIVANSCQEGAGALAGAESDGGGIATNGNGTLLNTIVAQNTVLISSPDIAGNLTFARNDLVGDGSGSNVPVGGTNGNQVGTGSAQINPHLGILQNNGGPTLTMMPGPNSTAINRGGNQFLATTIDQRGLPRVIGGTVDIGAIEVQPLHFLAVGADLGGTPEVKVFDAATGTLRLAFNAYELSFRGGVRVAVADINGDGVPDIITAPGGVKVTLVNVNGALMPSFDVSAGRTPEIKVFSGANGSVIDDFVAYTPTFRAGLYVAVADVNGDGKPDIVSAPDATGQSGNTQVSVFFNGSLKNTGAVLAPDRQFNAYDPGFGGGVRLAASDLNGDGFADMIVAPGIWSGPDVRVFDGKTLTNSSAASKIGEFLAYDPHYFGGVFVSTGDVNGDGRPDIITGTNGNGGPEVKAFSGANVLSSPTPTIIDDFFAYDPAFNGGARVAVLDVNGDGKADIITGAGPGGGPHVRIFDGATGLQLQGGAMDSFMAFDVLFSGGVFVGAG